MSWKNNSFKNLTMVEIYFSHLVPWTKDIGARNIATCVDIFMISSNYPL